MSESLRVSILSGFGREFQSAPSSRINPAQRYFRYAMELRALTLQKNDGVG